MLNDSSSRSLACRDPLAESLRRVTALPFSDGDLAVCGRALLDPFGLGRNSGPIFKNAAPG